MPVVTQYASAELIEQFRYGGRAHTDDPRWRESGAPDLETYAAWSQRWCGMACLRMVLLGRDGVAPTLWELAVEAAAHGAYSDAEGAPGGLIYAPFVAYLPRAHGLSARS